MLLIGSRALKFHLDYLVTREPRDWDFICYKREIKDWPNYFGADDLTITKETPGKLYGKSKNKGNCEFELIKEGTSAESYIEYLREQEYFDKRPAFIVPAPLSVLFSIKKSHITFPVKFQKHIVDYHLLKDICKVDKIKEITKQRTLETEKRFNLPKIDLNKPKKDFFTQNVKRVFEHDDIHNIIKFEDEPMFKKIQPPGSEVFCSKDLFNELTGEQQIRAVIEEATVIALERFIIPFLYCSSKYYHEEFAFRKSLEKLCTTMTKGWFREFAIDNYFKIVESRRNYVEVFLKGL